jgi:hypothetical protein
LIQHPTFGQVKIALEKSLVQLQAIGILRGFLHTHLPARPLLVSLLQRAGFFGYRFLVCPLGHVA